MELNNIELPKVNLKRSRSECENIKKTDTLKVECDEHFAFTEYIYMTTHNSIDFMTCFHISKEIILDILKIKPELKKDFTTLIHEASIIFDNNRNMYIYKYIDYYKQ